MTLDEKKIIIEARNSRRIDDEKVSYKLLRKINNKMKLDIMIHCISYNID